MAKTAKSPTSLPSKSTLKLSTWYDGVREVRDDQKHPMSKHLLTSHQGELLASAGDDGNVLLWTPSENSIHQTGFGEDAGEDLEHWRVKMMCRSNTGSEIYDLAWSPDGAFFVTGSMDNIARIVNASNGAFRMCDTKLFPPANVKSRHHRPSNSRAQPLRPGRRLGSSQ
jgi:WD40 repeat protein